MTDQMRYIACTAGFLLLSSCGSHNTPSSTAATSSLSPVPAQASYSPRVGVALVTGSRTCVAILNSNLTTGAQVTLVSPFSPQAFAQAEIAAVSPTPCPITKEVDPTVSNYDLHLSQAATLAKLTPLIAVVGSAGAFTTGANGNVTANLDQDNKTQSFRACSAADGANLTVWSGNPLDGTLLWHGYYYEPGNPGAGPACTPKETAAGG